MILAKEILRDLISCTKTLCKILLEVQVFECEVCLHDACGFDSGPEYILLSGNVARGRYPVQGIEVAGEKMREIIIVC